MTGLMTHTNIRTTSTRGNWSLNSHQCHHHCSSSSLLLLFPLLLSPPGLGSSRPAQQQGSSSSHDEGLSCRQKLCDFVITNTRSVQTKEKRQGVAGAVELKVGVVVKSDGLFKGVFRLPLSCSGIDDSQAWIRELSRIQQNVPVNFHHMVFIFTTQGRNSTSSTTWERQISVVLVVGSFHHHHPYHSS